MSIFRKVNSFTFPRSVAVCPECNGRLVCDDVDEGNLVIACADEPKKLHQGDQVAWMNIHKKCLTWAKDNIRIES